jgi:hypothetical protein
MREPRFELVQDRSQVIVQPIAGLPPLLQELIPGLYVQRSIGIGNWDD